MLNSMANVYSVTVQGQFPAQKAGPHAEYFYFSDVLLFYCQFAGTAELRASWQQKARILKLATQFRS